MNGHKQPREYMEMLWKRGRTTFPRAQVPAHVETIPGAEHLRHGGRKPRRCVALARPLLALQNVGHSSGPHGVLSEPRAHGTLLMGVSVVSTLPASQNRVGKPQTLIFTRRSSPPFDVQRKTYDLAISNFASEHAVHGDLTRQVSRQDGRDSRRRLDFHRSSRVIRLFFPRIASASARRCDRFTSAFPRPCLYPRVS